MRSLLGGKVLPKLGGKTLLQSSGAGFRKVPKSCTENSFCSFSLARKDIKYQVVGADLAL
jgi:hypothetical protein